MPTGRSGSIKLFRLHGIEVFLHWSWFLVAVYMIKSQAGEYGSIPWNVLEYLGAIPDRAHPRVWARAGLQKCWRKRRSHRALAARRRGLCRSTSTAGRNPVEHRRRAAGERRADSDSLGYDSVAFSAGWAETMPNAMRLLANIFFINKWLLIFNILPIFPLDGGQILRSLLWFVLGRARSLLVATVLGFLGAAAFIFFAYKVNSTWLIIMAVFMVWNCWAGMKQAFVLLKMAKIPRRENFSCPTCNSSPPLGAYWRCGKCGNGFDTFASGAACPHCAAQYPETRCFDCGRAHPMNQWTKHIVVENPSELISRASS